MHRSLVSLGTAFTGALLVAACASSGPPRPSTGSTRPVSAADDALGIPPFGVAGTTDSTLTPLSFALSDLLTTDIARSRRVTLVERARLGEVLRELDLAASGRVDSATAPRVGRLIQARRLLVGSVTPVPGTANRTLRLGVRVADVQSGALAASIDARAPLADILTAEKALAFRVFDALGVSLAPDERAAVEQQPTSNIAALLAYGEGVRKEYLGDYRGAAAEFRRAARLDPKFRSANDRASEARTLAEAGVPNPMLIPGLRASDAVVGLTIDRLNRPLDPISSSNPSSRAGDPAFPVTAATVILTVTRP